MMSKAKTPRGIRNNNPLAIRKGNNWLGERHPQSDPAFEEFESIEYGLRAAFILLRNYITGGGTGRVHHDTIDKIIRRWAPEVENATERYIDYVSHITGISRYQRVWFSDKKSMCAIVGAMAFVECGVRIDPAVISSAYDMV